MLIYKTIKNYKYKNLKKEREKKYWYRIFIRLPNKFVNHIF